MRPMHLLIPLLALTLQAARAPAAQAQEVRVPGPDGIMLNAELFLPRGTPRGAPVVELHSCSGPNPKRDAEWARLLAADGHIVLLPDSFGSRGLVSQCTNPSRAVAAAGLRRQDTLAAARWLLARPGTAPGGVVLMGWSDGATAALTLATAGPDLTPGLIRGVVAFYPGCGGFADRAAWAPAAPLLILAGEADRRSPPAACHVLADRSPGRVTLVTYDAALHDFDIAAPVTPPVAARRGRAEAPVATPNAVAWEDARHRVPNFIAQLP